jgi:hypothetical protein
VAREGGERRRGRETRQLDLGYRESSLALQKPGRDPAAAVMAGDRAPDARVLGAAGQPTRLFMLCRGPHWTLLGYHVDRASAPAPRAGLHIHTVGPLGDIIDNGGHLQRAYGLVPGEWVLIRPDGYIGATVSTTDLAALRDYLDGVGARATGA